MIGKVFIAGSGPGDMDLVTVGVMRLLQHVDVVLHDHLVNPSLINQIPEGIEIISVGKQGHALSPNHSTPQEHINDLMIRYAKEGKQVLRLKGGDPFIFGRGSEECEVLAEAGVLFDILPGVSSASSGPAYAGIPLTHREFSRSVVFATGHLMKGHSPDDIVIPKADTIVFLMGIKNLEILVDKLKSEGYLPETPCALIEQATLARQRTVVSTLAQVVVDRDKEGIKPPALFVVGKVVLLREKLQWFEKRPLLGKRLIVTRTREQAGDLVQKLTDLGVDVVSCPALKIRALPEAKTWIASNTFADFSDIVFTSENGVRIFFEFLYAVEKDARQLQGLQVIAIGPKTKDVLKEYGIVADVLPEKYQAEGLADILPDNLTKRRFLLPRAKAARGFLLEQIKERGGSFKDLPLYESVPVTYERGKAPWEGSPVDGICFTSASTVINFSEQLGSEEQHLKNSLAFCIGEVTAEAARKQGYTQVVVSEEATIVHLTKSILSSLT